MEMLIKYGVDTEAFVNYVETRALHIADKRGNMGCFEELRKGPYNDQSNEGQTALHYAAR